MVAFDRRGDDLTLVDVADEAGLAREAVRHYFPTVVDLLLAMQETLDATTADAHATSARLSDRIAGAIRFSYSNRGPAALTAILTARAVIDARGRIGKAMTARLARLRSELSAAVLEAQHVGEFRNDIDADTLALLLLAATQGLATQALLNDPRSVAPEPTQQALIRLFTTPARQRLAERPN